MINQFQRLWKFNLTRGDLNLRKCVLFWELVKWNCVLAGVDPPQNPKSSWPTSAPGHDWQNTDLIKRKHTLHGNLQEKELNTLYVTEKQRLMLDIEIEMYSVQIFCSEFHLNSCGLNSSFQVLWWQPVKFWIEMKISIKIFLLHVLKWS